MKPTAGWIGSKVEKKLLNNLTEYRQWAWSLYEEDENENENIAEAVGICPVNECWDSVLNEYGEYVDIDEDGSVIPKDTSETVALQDWVQELTFPVVAVYWLQYDDHMGFEDENGRSLCVCGFVSLSEFTPKPL